MLTTLLLGNRGSDTNKFNELTITIKTNNKKEKGQQFNENIIVINRLRNGQIGPKFRSKQPQAQLSKLYLRHLRSLQHGQNV